MVEIVHTYATPGNHLVTITGDLGMITSLFPGDYSAGGINTINVQGLTELKAIGVNIVPPGPRVIDLSNNIKLQYVSVAALSSNPLEDLILPVENHIRELSIMGCNHLITSRVDDVISKIYFSVVQRNEMNGYFGLGEDGSQESPMVGPPSSASITKLRELRDTFQWTIEPDLF